MRQVALGTAGFLADQAHGLKFVEQIATAGVDVRQAVHQLAAGVLHGRHDGRVPGFQCVVIGQCNRIDAGTKTALVCDAVNQLAC